MPALRSDTHPIDVHFLPASELPLKGRVGFTLAPGRKGPGTAGQHDRDLDADVLGLRRTHGATTLVSLVTDGETRERTHVPIDEERKAAERRGMTFHHFPVEPGEVPPEDELVDLVRLLRFEVELGRTVVVHDRAGGGRAATVAAALLIAQGREPDAAIAAVREVRAKAIEPPQAKALQRVAAKLEPRTAPLFAAVRSAFDEAGWTYERVKGTTVLQTAFDVKGTKVQVVAIAHERHERVILFGRLHTSAPEQSRGAVGELLHRINWTLTLGAFELDFDDGELRYRLAADVEGGELTLEMVKNHVHMAVHAVARFAPAIHSVAHGGVRPIVALTSPDA